MHSHEEPKTNPQGVTLFGRQTSSLAHARVYRTHQLPWRLHSSLVLSTNPPSIRNHVPMNPRTPSFSSGRPERKRTYRKWTLEALPNQTIKVRKPQPGEPIGSVYNVYQRETWCAVRTIAAPKWACCRKSYFAGRYPNNVICAYRVETPLSEYHAGLLGSVPSLQPRPSPWSSWKA
jgi:hypothetical protein